MSVVFTDLAHLFFHFECEAETAGFAYKYSKGLDVPVCSSAYSHQKALGVQWLSGRVHVSRLTGCGLKPHWHHCVVSLSKSHRSLLSIGPTKEDVS